MKTSIINTVMKHDKLGNVLILSKKPNSRTIYNVEQIDRGAGWDDEKQIYTGHSAKFKTGVKWARGENKEFGKLQDVHIKELKPVTK